MCPGQKHRLKGAVGHQGCPVTNRNGLTFRVVLTVSYGAFNTSGCVIPDSNSSEVRQDGGYLTRKALLSWKVCPWCALTVMGVGDPRAESSWVGTWLGPWQMVSLSCTGKHRNLVAGLFRHPLRAPGRKQMLL